MTPKKLYVKTETVITEPAMYNGKALYEALDDVTNWLIGLMILNFILAIATVIVTHSAVSIVFWVAGVICVALVGKYSAPLYRCQPEHTEVKQYVEIPRKKR